MLNKKNINKIFIRESNWIGDAIMTTPALAAIKENFSKAELFVGANPSVAEILKYNPCIDQFLIFDTQFLSNSLLGRLKLSRSWRGKYNFDLGILFTNSFVSALEIFIMGIPQRIGFDTDGRGLLLTEKIHATPEIIKKHEVDYFLEIVSGIGIKPHSRELILRLSEEDEKFARDFISKNRLPATRFLVALHAGASIKPKEWLPERYAKVCDQLVRNYNGQVIILGSKADEAVSSKIVSLAEEKIINLAGKISLRESASIIKCCDMFIGNNSGPMHIAAALNIPVVTIFGPASPEKTAPYLEKGKYEIVIKPFTCRPCRQNYFNECEASANGKPACIEAIEAEDVMKGIELLGRRLKII